MHVDGVFKVKEDLLNIGVLIQHLLVMNPALIGVEVRPKGRHALEGLPARLATTHKFPLEVQEAGEIGKQVLKIPILVTLWLVLGLGYLREPEGPRIALAGSISSF